MRIGLFVSTGGASVGEATERIARAERRGFRTAWVGQVFDVDALTLLALSARATRRIELGTWVVPAPLRHPVVLAQQALTLQAGCGERLALGVGASHAAVVEGRLGLDARRPLRQMREYLAVLRPLLERGEVAYEGEVYRVRVALGVPDSRPPPLLLAALGPRMLALAGSQADGAAIWLGGPRYLEEFAMPRLRDAARAAGRAAPRVACGLPIAVVRDESAARRSADAFLARSARLPAYRRVLAREGAESPGAVALVGDEDRVSRSLAHLASLGVTDFNAVPFPVEGDPDAVERTVGFLAGSLRGNV